MDVAGSAAIKIARGPVANPVSTLRRLGEALETLMKEDVVANRPMLAALCVSKMWPLHSRPRVLPGGQGSGGLFW